MKVRQGRNFWRVTPRLSSNVCTHMWPTLTQKHTNHISLFVLFVSIFFLTLCLSLFLFIFSQILYFIDYSFSFDSVS